MFNPISPIAHQLALGDVVLAIALALLTTWVVCVSLRLSGRISAGDRLDRYGRFAWQIGALLGLEQAYEFTRGQIPHETDVALLHAYRLLDLEWSHGLFVESRIERFFLQFHTIMNAIDLFYVVSHVAVTVGVMAWIYWRRRQYYPMIRNLLMVSTAIALISFYVYPTAPPRMLGNYGFVDPMQLHHFISAGGAQPDSYTYNPYAAMPSLHEAYAIIVGLALLMAERRWLVRALAGVYPLVMAAAVVISGNHWLLDVLGAFVTVAVAALLLLTFAQVQSRLLLAFTHVQHCRAAVSERSQ